MPQKPIRLELPTQFAMGTVNAYLFLEPDLTLVDCGEKSDQVWLALEKSLAVYGLAVSDLKRVIITHAHVDHIGMAGRIARESDAIFEVSDYVYPWLTNIEKEWNDRVDFMEDIWLKSGTPAHTTDLTRKAFQTMRSYWESVPADRVKIFKPDGTLQINHQNWEVIHTPGHAITQTCFYQPSTQWLISADMLMHITPTAVIEREIGGKDRVRALPQMLKSYQNIKELSISEVFPGHGVPFKEHQKLIDMQLARIHFRKEECLSYIRQGNHTMFQIANLMYQEDNPALKYAGFAMTRGYLDLLIEEGKITEAEKEGIWHFSEV